MGKLLGLKEWLTLEDAAAYLQRALEEPIRVAEVLQLALDGTLRISVRFASGAVRARIAHVAVEEVEFDEFGAPLLDFAQEPELVDGLWDLSLGGDGSIEIEKRMQALLGGPAVEAWSPAGLFLVSPSGNIWAALVELYIRDVSVDHTIQIEGLGGEQWPPVTITKRYVPLHELPTGAVVVARPAELTALVETLQLLARDQVPAPPAAKVQRAQFLKVVHDDAMRDPWAGAAGSESPQQRRERRLARLRELGGDLRQAGTGWQTWGKRGALAALVREEAAAGRPMADRKDVRSDLIAALGDQLGEQLGS